jgi:hypothetical protein
MEEKKIFLKMIVGLEKLNIPYMISGSVASILYGEPRLTNDIDVVVALKTSDIPKLKNTFPSNEFYVLPDSAILEELKRKGQFNIIHIESALKMACIILKDTEFELEQFKQRKKIPFLDNIEAFTTTPESIIINKMLFYKLGHSEKHIRDIIGILRISENIVNKNYIENWSKELQLEDIWNNILKQINNLDKQT